MHCLHLDLFMFLQVKTTLHVWMLKFSCLLMGSHVLQKHFVCSWQKTTVNNLHKNTVIAVFLPHQQTLIRIDPWLVHRIIGYRLNRHKMPQPSECGRQRTLNIVHAQAATQQQSNGSYEARMSGKCGEWKDYLIMTLSPIHWVPVQDKGS